MAHTKRMSWTGHTLCTTSCATEMSISSMHFCSIYFCHFVHACRLNHDLSYAFSVDGSPRPPIDSIMRLMTVWRITGKIIKTTIIFNYMHTYN